jgi:hypothetical protein
MRPKAYAAPVDFAVITRYRLTIAVAVACITVFVPNHSHARDDGRFANSPLKEWFDRLASKNGLCCAFADGISVQDVDWDTQDGHYRVRIQGEWIVVPDAAVVTEPNGSALLLHGPITTVTAIPKFAALCLALARNPFANKRGINGK